MTDKKWLYKAPKMDYNKLNQSITALSHGEGQKEGSMNSQAQNIQWDESATPAANEVYVKTKELTEEQASRGFYLSLGTGDSIEGILTGSRVNKFGKQEFLIEQFVTGKILVVTNQGNLAARIKDAGINVGDALKITYNGKVPMTSGKFKGTPAHNFKVVGEA